MQVLIVEEPSSEPRESKPANLVALKTNASCLRDSILQAEREEEWRGGRGRGGAGRSLEKQRKSLAELEAQLVLASPHLLFQVERDAECGAADDCLAEDCGEFLLCR